MKTLSSFALPETHLYVVDGASWWLRESGEDRQDSRVAGAAFEDRGNEIEGSDASPCFLRVHDQHVHNGNGGHH